MITQQERNRVEEYEYNDVKIYVIGDCDDGYFMSERIWIDKELNHEITAVIEDKTHLDENIHYTYFKSDPTDCIDSDDVKESSSGLY